MVSVQVLARVNLPTYNFYFLIFFKAYEKHYSRNLKTWKPNCKGENKQTGWLVTAMTAGFNAAELPRPVRPADSEERRGGDPRNRPGEAVEVGERMLAITTRMAGNNWWVDA